VCVFLGGGGGGGGGGGISERVEFGPCMGPHFLGAGYISCYIYTGLYI
jgi:hypothetical protein